MINSLPTEQFGVHLMVDGYGAPKERLADVEVLRNMLATVPEKVGMHSISEPLVVEVGPNNRKDPGGLSGVVLIAESHITFHTFPSRGFVTIDVYTCQNELASERLVQEFKKAFLFTEADTYFLNRGTKYPAQNIHE